VQSSSLCVNVVFDVVTAVVIAVFLLQSCKRHEHAQSSVINNTTHIKETHTNKLYLVQSSSLCVNVVFDDMTAVVIALLLLQLCKRNKHAQSSIIHNTTHIKETHTNKLYLVQSSSLCVHVVLDVVIAVVFDAVIAVAFVLVLAFVFVLG
jgi:hypothetical protein